MRYKAVNILGVAYGVKDTVTDEYVTGFCGKRYALGLARAMNDKYGAADYRDIEGQDLDQDELAVLLDDMANAPRNA